MNRETDPFIELDEIASIVGYTRACRIACELHLHIENTNNWIDDIGPRYPTVRTFVENAPNALSQLYVDAYPVFDSSCFVRWFAELGFDGAIHGGCGETFGEPEYKVFHPRQAAIMAIQEA